MSAGTCLMSSNDLMRWIWAPTISFFEFIVASAAVSDEMTYAFIIKP